MPTPARSSRWWRPVVVAIVVAAAAGGWLWRGAPEGPRGFRCPMHPAVVMERKGTCPTCGMELVERPLEAGAPATEAAARRAGGRDSGGRVQYTCPMHPAFVAEDPKVRCPECGMELVVKRPAPGPAVAPSAPR